jgi:hypothetical protein
MRRVITMRKRFFGLGRAGLALGLVLLIGGVFAQGAAAQEGNGLVTDFTTEGGAPLVTKGEYLLRGTTLVQYQGKAAEVIIPADLGITEIGDEVFYRSGIRSVAIPEGVKKLGVQSFSDCYHLETITLPRSLVEIGRDAFSYCGDLIAIRVDGANRAYADREGVLFTKSFTELIVYPAGKPGSSYGIPAGVTAIGDGAFSGSENLSSIILPASLTVIGERAFAMCRSLNSIALPASLTAIGNSAFSYCSSLNSIALPASLTTIGDYAFSGCSSLKSITVSAPKPPVLTGSLWSAWSAPPAVIYVPAAALDAYKNEAGWKIYADRIQAAGN